MRVYLNPSVSRLLATATLVASLGLLGLAIWKAVTVWDSDPTLHQIQQLLNQDRQSK